MSFHQQLEPANELRSLTFSNVKTYPATGISVLVVGAGVGGLVAALECRRKGHDVRVIERTPSPSAAGDFFSIGPNILRHFHNFWPDLAAECERINHDPWLAIHKITGERVSGPEQVSFGAINVTLADGAKKTIPFQRHNRPKFVAALLAQARGAGVDITFGTRVVDYFEDGESQQAGVLLEDGSRLKADVVIAADGVGTKSNKVVNGHSIRAYPSGFSIFRTAFPVGLATSDADIRDRWPLLEGGRSYVEMWGGQDTSFGVQRFPDIISWFLMHKDVGTGVESWSQHVDVSKVLELTSKIPGFPEIANKLIKTTPQGGIVDWEIMWRDPRENWISPLGRVVQVGDSAHTFLPSSGSGATQAMEDAISITTCLQIGGTCNIGRASQIHNKLRFQRVSCFQLNGFVNHQRQNNTDFEVIGEDGESFKSHIGKWGLRHDPEKYAYDNYGKVLNHLLSGAPFQSTNIPPGYTYEPWTIQEMFGVINRGEQVKLSGDWS